MWPGQVGRGIRNPFHLDISVSDCVDRSIFFRYIKVAIGSGGSVLLNTVRRDSERAKRLLGYAAVSGMLNFMSFGLTVIVK